MSQPNIERLSRLAMSSPYLGIVSLGVPSQMIPKLAIAITYTFMTLSMYAFLTALLRHLGSKNIAPYSILGAFVFAYSPPALQFVGSITLAFSLGALPLLLYCILTKMKKPYFPLMAAAILLLSLGHPFVFIMNLIVSFAFTLIIYRKGFFSRLIFLRYVTTAILFVLLFSWFIIPYMSQPVTSIDFGRENNISQDTFQLLSDNNSYDITSLERERFKYIDTTPANEYIQFFHYFAISLLVSVSFTSLLSARRPFKTVVIFSAIGFLLSTLFSFGSSGVLGESYWFLVSQTPVGWMLRSPLKFQLYQSFFISILFVSALVLVKFKFHPRRRVLTKYSIAFLSGFILVGSSGYSIYDANVNSLNPIKIPSEYYVINNLLASKAEASRVLYYPVYSESSTTWSGGHVISAFDSRSSRIPTYDLFLGRNNVKEILYTYPYNNDLLRSSGYYDFLTSMGIKYIVFHLDRIAPNNEGYPVDQKNLDYLLKSDSLTLEYESNDWYLFQIKPAIAAPINAISNIALVDSNDDLFKISSPTIGAFKSSNFNIDTDLVKFSALNGTVKTSMENILQNPSFVSWSTDDVPNGWHKQNRDFTWTSTSLDTGAGKYALRISTSKTGVSSWSGIISDPIKVKPTEKYLFTTEVATKNVFGTHVKIQGHALEDDTWSDISYLTPGMNGTAFSIVGDHAETDYWKTARIPSNVDMIRYVINSGTVLNPSGGDAITWVSGTGVYNLDATTDQNDILIEYKKISPTSWKVNVNSTRPFVLSLAETFDSGWVASSGNYQVSSKPLYGVINGFYIDKVGTYTLNIEYRPQKLFEIGLTISIVTIIVALAHLAILNKGGISVIHRSVMNKLLSQSSLSSSFKQMKTPFRKVRS